MAMNHPGVGDPLGGDNPYADGRPNWSLQSKARGQRPADNLRCLSARRVKRSAAACLRSAIAWRRVSGAASGVCVLGTKHTLTSGCDKQPRGQRRWAVPGDSRASPSWCNELCALIRRAPLLYAWPRAIPYPRPCSLLYAWHSRVSCARSLSPALVSVARDPTQPARERQRSERNRGNVSSYMHNTHTYHGPSCFLRQICTTDMYRHMYIYKRAALYFLLGTHVLGCRVRGASLPSHNPLFSVRTFSGSSVGLKPCAYPRSHRGSQHRPHVLLNSTPHTCSLPATYTCSLPATYVDKYLHTCM
jgi:hypothetical protein